MTPEPIDLADGKPPLEGEMCFDVIDQPTFAVAGFWQHLKDGAMGFTTVTCDPNKLVAPIHPKAMITVLRPGDHELWRRGFYDEGRAAATALPGRADDGARARVSDAHAEG
jgi:putative SOS response-associated peptidase YedK